MVYNYSSVGLQWELQTRRKTVYTGNRDNVTCLYIICMYMCISCTKSIREFYDAKKKKM